MIQIKELLEELSASQWAELCPPADPNALAVMESKAAMFPPLHLALLRHCNGVNLYHGGFRLFGVGCEKCRELFKWNDVENWKFAWDRHGLEKYLCFAENGWGYQWAYDLSELQSGRAPRIHWFSPHTIEAEVLFDSFELFAKMLLVRWARQPIDPDSVPALQKHGPLAWSDHIVYTPSLLLGTESGDIEHTMPMDATRHMIFNGDLYRQIGDLPDGTRVLGVEVYSDAKGRARLKAILPDGCAGTSSS